MNQQHWRRGMGWVIAMTIFVVAVTNLPLLFGLRIHGSALMGRLWGWAPNQFLFLSVIFPFATFFTFTAFRMLLTELRPTLPTTEIARIALHHWTAALLAGVAIAAILGVVIYFWSVLSLDKLRTEYAHQALADVEFLERLIALEEPSEQDAVRRQIIAQARGEIRGLVYPRTDDPAKVGSWLRTLEPAVRLQILQNPSLQLRLDLLNPTLQALHSFQLLLALVVAFSALLASALVMIAGIRLHLPKQDIPSITTALQSLLGAVFLFSLYPLLFHQYRTQIEEFVGSGGTIMQHLFSAVLVLGLVFSLTRLYPTSTILVTFLKYSPLAILVGGFFLEFRRPDFTRELFGRDTTAGIQIMIAITVTILCLLYAIALFVPRGLPDNRTGMKPNVSPSHQTEPSAQGHDASIGTDDRQ